MRELHDHYFHRAKREGYVSRAAYKLIEIDERKHVLARGDRVLDCGCAPGSWVQAAAKRVGPKGSVVGIDLKPTKAGGGDNVRCVVADVTTVAADELMPLASRGRPAPFDVVLSDMAPNTSGDRDVDHYQSVRLCDAVLDLCAGVLRPGGKLVMKVFEGPAYPELLQRCRDAFTKVKGFKPPASRSISREMYVIAEGYRGSDASDG